MVRPCWSLSVLLSRWATHLLQLSPTRIGCSRDSQALYSILLRTLLGCFAGDINGDAFVAPSRFREELVHPHVTFPGAQVFIFSA